MREEIITILGLAMVMYIAQMIYNSKHGQRDRDMAVIKQIETEYLNFYATTRKGQDVALIKSKMPEQLIDKYVELTAKYNLKHIEN